MRTSRSGLNSLVVVAVAAVSLAACSTGPAKPDGADNLRARLTQLQSDSQLADRAPVEIKEAEQAVRAAEVPRDDTALGEHLVFMAERKIDIARSRAQTRLYEDQRSGLSEQRADARLDSRTREANLARSDARDARMDAEAARLDTAAARRESDDLQRQVDELNARETDRGLVVTLGDLLFDSGKSQLRSGTNDHLEKLAAFLNQYPDRDVIIEGHTDSVGSDGANQALSQQRADSVKSYLVGRGVDSGRLDAEGKGESIPVASNDSVTGRQQNRRVEVIISHGAVSMN